MCLSMADKFNTRISHRAEAMPSSPIRRLSPLAESAVRRGVKVYHLNIGQPDVPTPQCGLDALSRIDRKVLEYSPSQGYESLRVKMSEYYSRFGIYVGADDIIVTTGGSEAILFAYMACLDPGDEIIVTDPSYANYMAFAISCGAVVRSVKTSIHDGFRLPPIEDFEREITPRTRAILICNPNNPTGMLYTREEMLQLRDIVLKHKLLLFSDEVYREFLYLDEPSLSVLQLEGIEQQVVLVDSVSKRYNECGIRIGALVTRNPLIRSSVMKFCQARLSPPLLGQIVAEASFDAPQEYMDMVHDEYRARRDLLVNAINEIPGVYAPMPQGAFYVMAELPVDDADGFCRWCLNSFEDNGETLMMAPGSGFYTNPEEGRRQVRLAYVLRREDLSRAAELLRKALEAYPGRIR